jgi:dipeptidase E
MAEAMKTGAIVAIGGGNIRTGETRRIDERVVELTGTSSPRVLFVPTATVDRPEYIESFRRVYGDDLGCRVDVLALYADRSARTAMAGLVAAADAIYVGGGNTLRMMMLWRRLGVDRLLRAAHERGAVLAGTSAGGICWFRDGHSDSRSYSAGEKSWQFIKVRGLGLIDATFCPHYHAEKREGSVSRMVARDGGVVVACDNCTAIEVVDGRWRVYRSRRMGKAYRIVREHGVGVVERLPADHEFRPMEMLVGRGRAFSGTKEGQR